MADFRRLFYAFAIVALLVGFTVPASAQSLMTCSGTANNPLIRGEDYTAHTGDIFISCVGGTATAVGSTVPKVDITIFTTTTTITSKLTEGNDSSNKVDGNFNETLLIFDEAGSAADAGKTFPMLNCGNLLAPFAGSTPFSCDLFGVAAGKNTYCGKTLAAGSAGALPTLCESNKASPNTSDANAGRPNVFQGRQVSTSAGTAIQFLGIPLDAGTTPSGGVQAPRLIRITNLRVDATKLGIYGNTGAFTNSFIGMTVTFNSNNFGASQVINVVVGTVRGGLVVSSTSGSDALTSGMTGAATVGNFLQCSASAGAAKKSINLTEGFSTAFKVRNWRQIEDNGTWTGSDWNPNSTLTTLYNTADLLQNVPNAMYNTESGLMFNGSTAPATNNPPMGLGSTLASPNKTYGVPFAGSGTEATDNHMERVGTVTQGTRLYVKFGSYPAGSNPSIPNLVALRASAITTGYIALVVGADANGAGGSPVAGGTAAPTFATVASPQTGTWCATGCTLLSSLINNTAVYEVIMSNPSAIEAARVPVFVNPTISLSASPSTPDSGPIMTATAGFAPFYAPLNGVNLAKQMDATSITLSNLADGGFTYSYPVQRFIDNQSSTTNVYDYGKCACDLLFPWVVGDATFTTSIVVANTSLDPCNGVLSNIPAGTCTAGFNALPNAGKVTFWYYGTAGINLDPNAPLSTQASQTSTSSVPAGSYLAHIVSPSAAGTTTANGLVKLSGNFAGYVIVQAQFLYCHGIAAISANVPGFGTQTYIGLTLDKGTALSRTVQVNNDGLVH